MSQEPSIIMGGDTDMTAKLLHLETEVQAKKGEIVQLREQVRQRENKNKKMYRMQSNFFISIFI